MHKCSVTTHGGVYWVTCDACLFCETYIDDVPARAAGTKHEETKNG